MLHQVEIEASADALWEALTTAAGLQSWWTADCDVQPEVASVSEFRFCGGEGRLRMQIEALAPGRRLVWACLGEDAEWNGTRLTWSIEPAGRGLLLGMVHSGWRSTGGMFALCNTTWGELLFRLKDHVEGRCRGPLFE